MKFRLREWIYGNGTNPHSIIANLAKYYPMYSDTSKPSFSGDLSLSDGRDCFTMDFFIETTSDRDQAVEVLKRLRHQINKLALAMKAIPVTELTDNSISQTLEDTKTEEGNNV